TRREREETGCAPTHRNMCVCAHVGCASMHTSTCASVHMFSPGADTKDVSPTDLVLFPSVRSRSRRPPPTDARHVSVYGKSDRRPAGGGSRTELGSFLFA